jgi:uncharacterized protein
VTGTVYLIHKVGNDMRRRNSGRILITGSIAGFIVSRPSTDGTEAFLNSFSFALREELKETKVTVTCLMPGATETEFFKRRADMMETDVGTTEKDDTAEVANNGFEAMMKGEGDVVSGFKNKVQSAVAHVMPAGMIASQHRKMAEPGSATEQTSRQCRDSSAPPALSSPAPGAVSGTTTAAVSRSACCVQKEPIFCRQPAPPPGL